MNELKGKRPAGGSATAMDVPVSAQGRAGSGRHAGTMALLLTGAAALLWPAAVMAQSRTV